MSKEELLNDLASMGIDPKSGRHLRSDKGKSRGPNTKQRSDKGKSRLTTRGVQKEPLAIYLAYKAKLLNLLSNSDDPKYTIYTDENGIFVPVTKEKSKIYKNYTIVHQSQLIARTVKHIGGKTIDLEKYRFEALQSIANNRPITEKTMHDFWKEINDTFATTTLELFVRLYHIKEEEYIKWSYKRWREDYSIISDMIPLAKITLSFEHRPGSEEFLPDFKFRLQELREDKEKEILLSKEYTNVAARIRDEEYAKAAAPFRKEILANSEYKYCNMSEIDRLAYKKVDKACVDNIIKERLTKYVEEKLNEK